MSGNGSEFIEVRNPRTGQSDYQIAIPSKEELQELCENLRTNQFAWEAMGVSGRVEVLKQWKDSLQLSREDLLSANVADTGRIRESLREVDNISKWVDRWSKIAIEQFKTSTQDTSISTVKATSDYSAYQLVGVISPWNFPLSLSLMDAIPALLSGCAVVIKPSEITPRFIKPMMESIERVPELAKVMQYVTGAGETGAELIEHIDMICFTGSVSTGRKVAVRAAERFIPAFLELGGKDPVIVTETADIDRATSAILVGSVLGVGHQCYSLERIYVAESIETEFVEKLTEKANKLKLAYPTPESGEIGPIIFAPQAEIIKAHLDDAVEKGAVIHCGGEIQIIDGGLWCRPTVVTNVTSNMKLIQEETFGPIMPVITFQTIEEAIELANDSKYGLSGAVFAGTIEEGEQIAQKVDVGGISINDTGLSPFFIGDELDMEKTSFKSSGLGGSRIGISSIKRFVRRKVLFSNHSTEKSAWWYE
ncbi:aldehyde dehydrogenase family protein [Sporosarcina sp. PTS2304]|uniref:aldehyde dehydrogenase family protein n=1 Tax=Sporosarcina sp. PTS2304 TaxID=2283194 RepID=UPI000E0DE2D5|nr:aldehyde dehydrogenase family protein [Sporosarcina sp. PTS2304]AXH99545.1 aldehyde dehydrogenase family protein [Sporosarcina sp. PTS2304]